MFMKTKLLNLLLIIGIGLLISCDNDDNDIPQEKTINGTWNLINVRGGFAPVNINYSKGDVKWIFNRTDSTLFIQNKIGNDNAFMLHTGFYNFNIERDGDTQVIFVDEDDYRIVILSLDNNLIITNDMSDGFTAEFKR